MQRHLDKIDGAVLLAGAYGANEPEYTLDMLKQSNPDYEGR